MTATAKTPSYNSYNDYAEAYGYTSVDEYMKARASHDASNDPGHHAALCNDSRCSCKSS